jgi:hypothetical protein
MKAQWDPNCPQDSVLSVFKPVTWIGSDLYLFVHFRSEPGFGIYVMVPDLDLPAASHLLASKSSQPLSALS